MAGQEGTSLSDGCQHAGRALHGPLNQCRVSRVWYPDGLENHPGHARRRMASVLGKIAGCVGRSGAARLEGDPDGRPGTVCSLALSGDTKAGMAPDAPRQRGPEFSDSRRRELQSNGRVGEEAWSWLEWKGRME